LQFAKILANGIPFARYFCEGSSLGNWLSKKSLAKLTIFAREPPGLGNKSMPIGFLTDAQRRSYGRFNGEPTSDQLTRYFHLDDAVLKIIGERRGDHNRLGFAVQLCTVRFLGTFLENLSETAPGAVAFLGCQLGLKDPSVFSIYCLSEARWDHASEIRSRYGFREFTDRSARFRLNRWLYALCWTGTDRPSALFDRAIAWLITHKILLPGVTVLERHIVRIRTRAQERVWLRLTQAVSSETKTKLEALLMVSEEGHVSMLDRLRKGPFLRSAPELVRALRRIDDVRGLGINLSVSSRVPPSRVQALARFATMAKASAINRMPDHRRIGTLIAFVLNLEAIALDDALDLLDILITEIFAGATRAGEKARLRTIKDLDEAAGRLGQVCALLLDPSVADSTLREAVFAVVKRQDLEAALRQVERLVRPPENMYYRELQKAIVGFVLSCQVLCKRCVSALHLRVGPSWKPWNSYVNPKSPKTVRVWAIHRLLL
jgi:hypothetical protein